MVGFIERQDDTPGYRRKQPGSVYNMN